MTEPQTEWHALDIIPDEVNITLFAKIFGVRRATASRWLDKYNIQYRMDGNNKLISKDEVRRVARERHAE